MTRNPHVDLIRAEADRLLDRQGQVEAVEVTRAVAALLPRDQQPTGRRTRASLHGMVRRYLDAQARDGKLLRKVTRRYVKQGGEVARQGLFGGGAMKRDRATYTRPGSLLAQYYPQPNSTQSNA